jgi:hypothetical protein
MAMNIDPIDEMLDAFHRKNWWEPPDHAELLCVEVDGRCPRCASALDRGGLAKLSLVCPSGLCGFAVRIRAAEARGSH